MVLPKDVHTRPDTWLVEACRGGDDAAFAELVRRYKDRVFHVAYRFLSNYEDASDVAQDAFIRAYNGLAAFRGDAKVSTWLYSIVTNLARNRLRYAGRKGRDRSVSLEALAEDAPGCAQAVAIAHETPCGAAMGHELEEVLQGCLEKLPEHCRMVFVLRMYEELNYADIAEVMGIPVGTVKSRLNEARALLRDRLKALAVL